MQKRPLSLHSDSDLRNSVANFDSLSFKAGYHCLISYMNGEASDKGWVIWKTPTIQNICYLTKSNAQRFMECKDVVEKLVFGRDKKGVIWVTHKRTQRDLHEYFKGKFETKEIEILDGFEQEKTQVRPNCDPSETQVRPNCDPNSHHNSLKNNKNEDTIKRNKIKEIHIQSECVDINIIEEKKIEQKVRRSTHAIPTFEEVLEYTNFHAFKFSKLDVKKWYEHWELLGWIDKNGNSFDWKQKIVWALNDKTFLIKNEVETQKPLCSIEQNLIMMQKWVNNG